MLKVFCFYGLVKVYLVPYKNSKIEQLSTYTKIEVYFKLLLHELNLGLNSENVINIIFNFYLFIKIKYKQLKLKFNYLRKIPLKKRLNNREKDTANIEKKVLK